MTRGFRLIGATINYGLAGYVPQIVNFLLLPVYARYLSPAEMGVVEIALTVQVLFQAVFRLGLPGAFVRQYFDSRDPQQFRDLVTTLSLGSLAGSIGGTALCLLLAPPAFSKLFPEIPFHPGIDIALVTALFQVGPELQQRVLQAKEQSWTVARLTVFFGLFGTAAKVALVVGMRWGVLGVLTADLVTAVFGFIVACVRHRDDLRGRFRRDLLGPALAYGLPLVPHRLGAWLHQYAGSWLVVTLGSIALAGQVSVASRIVSPLKLAVAGFATAFAPVYFSWRKELSEQGAVREVQRAAAVAIGIVAVGALGCAAFGSIAIHVLLPASYRAAAELTGVLAAAQLVGIVYNIVGMELLYAKRTKPMALIFFSGGAVNLAATALLIPPLGALGASFGQLIGTVALVLVTLFLSQKSFPPAVSGRTVAAGTVGVAVACVLPFLLEDMSRANAIVLGALGILATTIVVAAVAGFRPANARELIATLRRRRTKPQTAAASLPASASE